MYLVVDICHFTFTQTHRIYTPRMSPNVSHGPWIIMVSQFRFINCNKCTTVVEDVDNGGGYAHVKAGGVWEVSTNLFIYLFYILAAPSDL